MNNLSLKLHTVCADVTMDGSVFHSLMVERLTLVAVGHHENMPI